MRTPANANGGNPKTNGAQGLASGIPAPKDHANPPNSSSSSMTMSPANRREWSRVISVAKSTYSLKAKDRQAQRKLMPTASALRIEAPGMRRDGMHVASNVPN